MCSKAGTKFPRRTAQEIALSLDVLPAHSQIQLRRGRQIRTNQVYVAELHGAVVALRIQKIEQRGSAMLIRKVHGIADSNRLVEISSFIGLQKNHIAVYQGVGGIDIAEHLRLGGVQQFLVSIDVQLGAKLFPLIAVK